MDVKHFINQVFSAEFGKLLDSGFHYISFTLIALGIEFLGACLDEQDFAARRLSKRRFTRAIRNLFPVKYHVLSVPLYEDLRNGFAHQFRPGFRFALTHRAESVREKTTHLGVFNNQTVLVAEDFYEDFRRACTDVINRIDQQSLTHQKLTRIFLSVT